MSKATRLIQLLHELRMYSPPVTAQTLAEAMAVSERTIYRDIDALRAAGAVIDGEAGFGYTLTEDPALPPQMFSHDEIEALVLGLREVREIADPALATAAESALAKLRATLPDRLKSRLEHAVLYGAARLSAFDHLFRSNSGLAGLVLPQASRPHVPP